MLTRRGTILIVVGILLVVAGAGAAFAVFGAGRSTTNLGLDPAQPGEPGEAGDPERGAEAGNAQIQNDAVSDTGYWTPERMEDAKPYPMPRPQGPGEQPSSTTDSGQPGILGPPQESEGSGSQQPSNEDVQPYPMPNPTSPDG